MKVVVIVKATNGSEAGEMPSTDVLTAMGEYNQHPVIFALSNPTSKAECTAEEAYTLTGGRAIFASGSPFPTMTINGKKLVPGQGNNAYIFPGVGLGVVSTGARRVTDSMFIQAARTLASLIRDEELAEGRVYPSLNRIHEVSHAIAMAVAEEVYAKNLTNEPRPDDLAAFLSAQMFKPVYPDYSAK